MKNAYLWIGAAVIIVLIAGYYLLAQNQRTATINPNPTPTTMPPIEVEVEKNLVEAEDQSATTTIVTSLVRSEKPGFIAIHIDQNGQPGAVIGNSKLFPSGDNRNIIVTLSQPVKPGNVVYAMYHTDANGNSVYEFPGDDAPVKDSAGNTVMDKITIL